MTFLWHPWRRSQDRSYRAYPARTAPDSPLSALHVLTTGLAPGDDAAWVEFHRDFVPGVFRRLIAETRGDHDLAVEAKIITDEQLYAELRDRSVLILPEEQNGPRIVLLGP